MPEHNTKFRPMEPPHLRHRDPVKLDKQSRSKVKDSHDKLKAVTDIVDIKAYGKEENVQHKSDASLSQIWMDRVVMWKGKCEMLIPSRTKEFSKALESFSNSELTETKEMEGNHILFREVLSLWDKQVDPFETDVIPIDTLTETANLLRHFIEEALMPYENTNNTDTADIKQSNSQYHWKGQPPLEPNYALKKVLSELATKVTRQLDSILKGVPFEIANPAESLIDSIYQSARSLDVVVTEDLIEKHQQELDKQTGQLKTKDNQLKLIDDRIDELDVLANRNKTSKSLSDNLRAEFELIQKELNDKKPESLSRNASVFKECKQDFADFLNGSVISDSLKDAFYLLKDADIKRKAPLLRSRNNINNNLTTIKNNLNKANAELLVSKQKSDKALNNSLETLEAINHDMHKLWTSAKSDFKNRLKQITKDTQKQKAIKSLGKKITNLFSGGLGNELDNYIKLAKNFTVKSSDNAINFDKMVTQCESILHLTSTYEFFINNAFTTALTDSEFKDLTDSETARLYDARIELQGALQATLMNIGSDLNYHHKINLSLQGK